MPRNRSRQATIRTGAPAEIAKPGASINARQPYVQYARVGADHTAGQAEKNIARAMSGLVNPMMKIARKKQVADEREAYERGRAAALQDRPEGIEAYNARRQEMIDAGESAAYIDGWAAQNGRATAYAQGRMLEQTILDSPDMSEEAFDELWTETVKPFVGEGGIQNEHFLNNYTDVLSNIETRLRSHRAKRASEAEYSKTVTDYDSAMRNDLLEMADQGGNENEVNTIITTYRDQAMILGLDDEVANDLILRNVAEIAERTGRLDVFKALDMPHVSVDNPDVILPALSDNAKYGRKIEDAKERVLRTLRTEDNVNRSEQLFSLDGQITEAIQNEDWSTAEELLEPAVENRLLTGSQAIGYRRKIEAARMEREQTADAMDHMYDGRGFLIADTKARNNAMNEIAGDLYAQYPDDPMAAASQIAGVGLRNSTPYKPHVQVMKYPNVANPEQFNEGYSLFKLYNAEDPIQTRNLVGREASAMYGAYQRLLEQGVEPAVALDQMQVMMDPANIKEAKRVFKENERTISSEIDDRLVDDAVDGGWFGWDSDATNATYVRSRVKENVMYLLQHAPGIDPELAIDEAIKTFEATHTLITDTDGEGQYWVYKGRDKKLPSDFNEAHQWFSEVLTKKYGAASYYIAPNPMDPSNPEWLVYESNTNRPLFIDEDGRRKQARQDVNKLMGYYRARKGGTPSPDEAAARRGRDAQQKGEQRQKTREETIRRQQAMEAAKQPQKTQSKGPLEIGGKQ